MRDIDLSARDRVLKALARSNRPLTNSELAEQCDVAPETISRVLKALVSEGLVLSRKAGRNRANQLTATGRMQVGALSRSAFKTQSQPASVTEPVSIGDFPKVEMLAPEPPPTVINVGAQEKADREQLLVILGERSQYMSRLTLDPAWPGLRNANAR
jgi:DNA-binding MarR family transcriptional regulator